MTHICVEPQSVQLFHDFFFRTVSFRTWESCKTPLTITYTAIRPLSVISQPSIQIADVSRRRGTPSGCDFIVCNSGRNRQ